MAQLEAHQALKNAAQKLDDLPRQDRDFFTAQPKINATHVQPFHDTTINALKSAMEKSPTKTDICSRASYSG